MMLPRQSYPLGRGYSVEFSFDGQRIEVVWSPRLPSPSLGRKLLPAYREARDQFLAGLQPIHGDIVVVDL